jgi:hypothetical protein
MMYSNKLAVAVKSNGKVLREFKDSVYVPFGTEYTILIKNLNSVRALVDVSIDGTDVGGGVSFVVAPNSEVELERFITNGNMNVGNRFKFIERTGAVEAHRGIGVEDGLIRISYQFEEAVPAYVPPTKWDVVGPGTLRGGYYGSAGDVHYKGLMGSTVCHDSYSLNSTVGATSCSVTNNAVNMSTNDVGVTVPGSLSTQQFNQVASFRTEKQEYVMVIRLLGETETGKQVSAPVTVKTKPRCITCGHQNKATAKFCSECGTALQIV